MYCVCHGEDEKEQKKLNGPMPCHSVIQILIASRLIGFTVVLQKSRFGREQKGFGLACTCLTRPQHQQPQLQTFSTIDAELDTASPRAEQPGPLTARHFRYAQSHIH